MADRNYIIEVLLQARDETARAFASATGQLEAYDKLLEEQRVKTEGATRAQQGYAREFARSDDPLKQRSRALSDLNLRTAEAAKKLNELEQAQRSVTKAQQEGRGGTAEYVTLVERLRVAEESYAKQLGDTEGRSRDVAGTEARTAAQRVAAQERVNATVHDHAQALRNLDRISANIDSSIRQRNQRTVRDYDELSRSAEQAAQRRAASEEKVLAVARRAADILAKPTGNQEQDIRATNTLAAARDLLARSSGDVEGAERRISTIRQQSLRAYGFESQAARDLELRNRAQAEAYRLVERSIRDVDTAERTLSSRRASGRRLSAQTTATDPEARALSSINPATNQAPSATGWQAFIQNIQQAQQSFAGLDTTTSGFTGHLRAAFGFVVVGLIQPFIALIVGLVGVFVSLTSAVIAAGTAISTSFISGMAEGIPIMGLFAAAMQRLQGVMGYVQALLAQQQQRFIANFQTAAQNAMGINQVVIAQHNYSDALFAGQQALRQVGIAELGLLSTRQSATRQLQQLIFQEVQARLAAEASTLAITQSQKSLQQAIATGGDVQQAQLQLAQAQAGHTQAVAQAQQAITDAAPGSIARQNIAEQVQQAQLAVIQAQRAVVDSQFAIAQARAGVIQAQQAARGYNIATAAQLAYLRSQMDRTELSLTASILRILGLFRGAKAAMRPLTDAILQPFLLLTNQIYKLLTDPRIFGALLGLARSMGSAMTTVIRAIFSNQSIGSFITLLKDAAANLAPLASIAVSFFRALQTIVIAAGPSLRGFLGWFSTLIGQWSTWAQSQRGKNWLKDWFDTAFKSLEAFISFGASLVRLVAAVIGVGGGAKSGISILKDLQGWVDRTTKSINSHGKAWHELKDLWASAKPVIHAVGEIIGAVLGAFLKLGSSKQGQTALKGLADFIAHVLVPAFVIFAQNIGHIVAQLTNFLAKHPALSHMLVDVIAAVATISFGAKAIGLLFGPIAALITLVGKLGAAYKKIGESKSLSRVFGGIKNLFRGGAAGKAAAAGAKHPALPHMLVDGEAAAAGGEAAAGGGEAAAGGGAAAVGGEAAAGISIGPILAVVAAVVALIAWTGKLGDAWNAIKAPFVQFWAGVKKPLDDFIKQLNYMLKPIGGVKGALEVFRHWLGSNFAATFKSIGDILGGLGRIVGNAIGTILRVLADVFHIIGDVLQGNFKRLPGDFLRIGKDIVKGFINGIVDLAKLFLKIFIDAWNGILAFFGISSPSKKARGFGQSIVDGIISAVTSLPGLFLKLGENMVKALFKGITSLAKTVGKAIWDLVPGPIRSIIGGVVGAGKGIIHGIGKGLSAINPFGRSGGPVFGTGTGDTVSAKLEPGEHVLTKGEVASAGGHGAIFALRRALGGGTQGGPFGFAAGGAVGDVPGVAALGVQNPLGQTTEGVTGILGSVLANLQAFSKQFTSNWEALWRQVNDLTDSNTKIQTDAFTSWFTSIQDFWKKTNVYIQGQLNTYYQNFKNVYAKVATDTFNEFWYILHTAQQSLGAFDARFTPPHLAQQPRFAEGGWVGNMGERGSDLVHALLGRGEAVLNWAHQKVVDPALRAVYGWGLDGLFSKVRGEHAGGFPGGYAQGGYIYPFPAGTVVGRTDQGVDADLPVGAPIGPMGRARVMGILQNWYQGQPYVWWELLDGLRRGMYAYVAEQITNIAPPGSILSANQAVARYAARGTGIEYGWATPGGATLAHVRGGYREGVPTAAGTDMRNFLAGLSHGLLSGGPGGIGGGALGSVWQNLKGLAVHGTGVLAEILRAASKKVVDAANAFGSGVAGTGSGLITNVAGLSGNLIQIVRQIAGRFNWNQYVPDWLKVITRESGGNMRAVNPKSGAAGIAQFIQGFSEYYQYGGNPNTLTGQLLAMANYMKQRYVTPAGAWASEQTRGFYREGGVVGQAVPIMAHVGEWVLNEMQQSKIAKWLGMPVEILKHALGFTGGKGHYQGGGVVHPAGTISPQGIYTPPNISVDTPGFNAQAIVIFNRAQARIITRIQNNGRNIAKGLASFLNNFNLVGGDGGLFALAAQAIQNFVSRQQSVVQLAAAGVRLFGQRLVFGAAQTAVQAAQSDLVATNQEVAAMVNNHHQLVVAFRNVNKEIRGFGPVTAKNLAQYQQLLGARAQLLSDINASDQSLAQALSDRYTKQVALFQAQNAQALRNVTNVQTRQQAAQQIAQSFGRIQDLIGPAGIDQQLLSTAQTIQSSLQQQYNQALAKAQHDPRWQTVADDLLGQLESATEAVAAAITQQLSDAIQAQDTQVQMQQAANSMRQAIFQAMGQVSSAFGSPSGQFAAISGQIGLSQQNVQAIQGQIGAYQNLFNQAAAQGNVGAMNTLTQTIDQLNTTMVQANVQTQQLITSYYQLSSTLASSVASSSSSFSQAASGIFQTLGQITGSLNLPQLIQIAQQAGAALRAQGSTAVGNIQQVLGGSQGAAFGAATGTANQWLSQAAAAFQQGPAAFAAWLSTNAQGLAQFQAGLPQDEQALFNSLIQALIDNTTSQVSNTQQLQQLNATTNQQAFTSTAWQMFRDAIFNGLGGLLPQYAMTVPAMDVGGMIMRSGLIYGHHGEEIVPASISRQRSSGDTYQTNHFNVDHPLEVADPVLFGNQVAWRLSHDPNSR